MRIKNSEEGVTSVIYSEQQFDTAHTNLVLQLAVFNDSLFRKLKSDPTKRDDLLRAIVAVQVRLLNLKNKLPASDQAIADEYASKLVNLTERLRAITSPADLKPILNSAQELLVLHDELIDAAESQMHVSIF